MGERPTIEFGGKKYERRDRCWVDTAQIRVPLALSARIDATARLSENIWRSCLHQDAADDLRKPRVGAKNRRKQNTRKARALHCEVAPGRMLRVRADLRQSWSKHPKTYGFVDEEIVPGLTGDAIRIQVKVLSGSHAEAPRFAAAQSDERGIRARVTGHSLELEVELFENDGSFNKKLGWSETDNGKPMVYRENWPFTLRIESDSRDLSSSQNTLSLLIVVQPPDGKPAPTNWDWESPFLSGGLPSLGKRHS